MFRTARRPSQGGATGRPPRSGGPFSDRVQDAVVLRERKQPAGLGEAHPAMLVEAGFQPDGFVLRLDLEVDDDLEGVPVRGSFMSSMAP